MKLVDMTCPHCGAQLQVNVELKMAVCNYCGKQMMMDDEVRRVSIDDPVAFGRDFERGRMNAQGEGADPKLVNDIRSFLSHMRTLSALEPKRSELVEEITKLKEHPGASPKERALLYVCLLSFFVILVFAAFISEEFGFSQESYLLALAPTAAIAWFAYRPLKNFAEKEAQEEQRNLDEKQRELTQCEADLQRCRDDMEKHHIDRIPEKYRTEDALSFFVDAFANGRALTIMQVTNLYEEELHHRRMQELQKEQIDLQKEQLDEQKRANVHADNVAGAAIATGALVVAGVVVKGILRK